MEFDHHFEKIGAVARITLNRPERANALESGHARRDRRSPGCAEGMLTVRAIVVRGAGAAFSSGFDLKEQMERRPRARAQWQPDPAQGLRRVMRFWHCPKPTIAAVRGPVSPAPASWRWPAT